MPARAEDDEDPDWEEEDFPDDDEESFTITCPACGAAIYEDAPQCPQCGEYVTRGSASVWQGKPVWYILLACLGIVAVIIVMLIAQ